MSQAAHQEQASAPGITLATMRHWCVLEAERIALVQDFLVKNGVRSDWAPSAALDVDVLNAMVRLLDHIGADDEIKARLKARAKSP